MIARELEIANETLEKLIEITKSDLTSIKEAKHDEIFSRIKNKEELAASFEAQKTLLDQTIAKAIETAPNGDFASVISENERALLKKLRDSLLNLRNLNKRFASLALTIGEFYNSLLNAVLPSESNGYGATKLSPAGFLQIRG
ncbi:MAG: flagellar protein FlgN [Helicobacteraceae bacterium]|jgi:ABC-type transporter Mla subunit MlaD|nr:flagellar protein FlgN [Helicobacteraceae bacterium]